MKKIKMIALSTLAMLGSTINTENICAQSRNDTIAQTGQAPPGGNGTYSTFNGFVLNDLGLVGFNANITGATSGTGVGIFRGTGTSVTQIVRAGQTAPGGGTYSTFLFNPVINSSGEMAFEAFLNGTPGGSSDSNVIVRASSIGGAQVVRTGQSAPGGGTFSGFENPALNDLGQAAFRANLTGTTNNLGIFRGSGGTTTTQIARIGQAGPGGGNFNSFLDPVLNDSGQVAFLGSGVTGSGIYRGSGGSLTLITRSTLDAPDGDGEFFGFGDYTINSAGQVAFSATVTFTNSGVDESGIFRGSGGSITQIARSRQFAPDGNGTLSGFLNTQLNDSGRAAFRGSLTGTSLATLDDTGIFVGSGLALTQVAREGQVVSGIGTLGSISTDRFDFNNAGQAAFKADIGTNEAILTGDGIDLFQVAREGGSLAGSTITSLTFDSGNLNEFGQIAYKATLANGNQVLSRWTPELHWRGTTSATWDTADRWTLGLTPGSPHDVFIDTEASLTVSGPAADTSVRSLQIGGGNGLATLSLRNGATLTATSGVTISSTGTLTGDGMIGGNVTNGGTIVANNVLASGNITNTGTIRGSGRVHAGIINNAAGKVRALNGAEMWLSGPSFSNAGLVEVNSSELRINSVVTNQASTGLISLRNGSLIADAGITNQGSIAATLGASTIQGDVNNVAGGIIQVSGGASATFFGDVVQNGTMQVAAIGNTRSSAVILGSFSGNGGFVGGGDVFALGDLRPGNSPGVVTYGGNLFMGTSTDTFIEIGGLRQGLFDQMLVLGDLSLNGSLTVSLINGFHLSQNQKFFIGDITGNRIGQFQGLGEGARVGNFGEFDLLISYLAGNGNDIALYTSWAKNGTPYLTGDGYSAVPEPSSLMLLGFATICGFATRQRNSASRT